MPPQRTTRRVNTGGGAFVNKNVTVRAGDFVGRDKIGQLTIVEGATVDEIVDALRKEGLLPRVTSRVPQDSFRRLLEIIARVTIPDAGDRFYNACRAALPPTAHLVNSSNPPLLLADICGQQQMPSKPWMPVFECVERFAAARGLDPQVAGDLRAWVDTNAGLAMPPASPKHIEMLRQELRDEATRLAEAGSLSLLQVYLEPDPLNRTQERKQPLYRVELVLWSPRTNGPLVLQSEATADAGSDEPRLWTLDELAAVLDDVFGRNETIALIPHPLKDVVIEIVAPSEVLAYGFDRWKRNNSSDTYGLHHPIVVRLRDRLAIPNPADQKLADDWWRLKWAAFRNNVCHKDCDGLQWRAQDELDRIELQDDANLVCLGLSSPVTPGERAVFETLRDAGIPIAVWMRGAEGGPAPPDWPTQISALIHGTPLSSLREAIRAVRRLKAVRTDRTHVGNALTLLWDDPDRPPLKYEAQGVFV
jgi:hypothetical protein